MRMLRITSGIAAIMSLSVLLSGCWDLVEINRSSLLTGVAIEQGKEHRLKLTFEMLNAAEAQAIEGGKGMSPTTIYTSEGDTLSDTVARLNEQFDRLLLLSHIRVILIDEHLARKGLNELLDAVRRSRYVREDVLILIPKDIPAGQVLQILNPGVEYGSLKIRNQIENFQSTWGGVPETRLFDITQATLAHGREPLLGVLKVQGPASDSSNMDSLKSTVPKSLVKVSGAGIFRRDKLIGFLSEYETRVVNLIRNQLKVTSLSVPLEDNKTFAAIRYQHAKTRINVELKEKKAIIRLEVEGEGQIGGIPPSVPIDKIKGYEALEQKTSEYITEEIKEVISKIQRNYQVDVFGFGEYLYRHHNGEFMKVQKDWNRVFSEADINVSVKVHIARSELKTKSLQREPAAP